ncbi:MAG: hypothetical protein BGO94_14610 [Micrococcales bacterium 72-143]|nr:MAG: hypothetical protein BGO94_14610 [Micrococcales bacterium 72-143]
MSWRAVAVFLVLAFGLAWLVELPVWLSGEGMESELFFPLTAVMMFTPTVAALVTVLLVKRPPSIPRLLGIWPLRPVGRTIGVTLLAGLVFTLLPIAALLLGGAMGLVQLDLVHFGAFAEQLAELGIELKGMPIAAAALLQFAALPLVTLQTAFATVGEELGWRGWLVPNLRPLGVWPALVVSGVVWGLWHAPVILLGYNYQRPDAVGLACMVLWTTLPGILLGWLRLRTASVWPAVFAHAAINATTGTTFVLLAAGQDAADFVWGTFLGWPGLILMTVLVLVVLVSGAWRREPRPGLTLAESRGGAAA